MSFAWPIVLWLLAAPAGWLAWEFRHRRKASALSHPHIVRAEAGIGRLSLGGRPAAAGPGSGRPRVWLCLGLALAIVALARPQWGRIDEPVFEQSREIVIALDLSRSMQTPDVKPTRLDRAKLLIQSLLEKLAGERVGLVSFAGTAFLQAPLSADYEILREFLPSLAPGFMPVGGTDYGALIDAASGAFSAGTTADRYLIILSDGGATDEGWRDHVAKLKEKGVRVIGLGVGTAQGALIPDGTGGFVKDGNGAVVMSKLETDTLKELCALTGGVYRDASQWVDLPRLLSATVESGRKGRFTEKNTARYAERYQWALAPALLLFLLSYYWEFPVRPKPRDIALAGRDERGLAAAALLVFLCAAHFASAATEAPAGPGALLGRIIGRISAEDAPGALDWLELGRQTLTWGQQLQSSGQPVPAGPVHDALAAADAGATLDGKAADWPKLRDALERLLKEPDQPKPKPKDQQKQQQDQKKRDQKNKQQQQQQQQKSQQNQQSSQSPQQQQQQNPSPDQSQSQSQPQSGSTPPSSAFGQMDKPAQPPPPSGGTQRVGGAREERRDPANADPAMAPLLQKLEEVRNGDSPAQLFQMFEKNQPRPPDKKGKDW